MQFIADYCYQNDQNAVRFFGSLIVRICFFNPILPSSFLVGLLSHFTCLLACLQVVLFFSTVLRNCARAEVSDIFLSIVCLSRYVRTCVLVFLLLLLLLCLLCLVFVVVVLVVVVLVLVLVFFFFFFFLFFFLLLLLCGVGLVCSHLGRQPTSHLKVFSWSHELNVMFDISTATLAPNNKIQIRHMMQNDTTSTDISCPTAMPCGMCHVS